MWSHNLVSFYALNANPVKCIYETLTILIVPLKRDRGWRTFKRPGVDAFLEYLAQYYEIVVYSDQLNMVSHTYVIS